MTVDASQQTYCSQEHAQPMQSAKLLLLLLQNHWYNMHAALEAVSHVWFDIHGHADAHDATHWHTSAPTP
jgi:hypothetical protein